MKYSLRKALIEQGYEEEEADEEIARARQAVLEGADPEEICYDFGLEPDYIWELLE